MSRPRTPAERARRWALAPRGGDGYAAPACFFLTPKYIKQGRLYIKGAQKRIDYNRDKWSGETTGLFDAAIVRLRAALKARDREAVTKTELEIEDLCKRHCPQTRDEWIGENVETFLVAIIVALGIRTFFLQPFTIPTASMQPTLFGITGRTTQEAPPNLLVKVWDFAWYGRSWHEVIAEADEQVTGIADEKRGGWRRIFTYTKITTSAGNEYFVNEHVDAFGKAFDGVLGKKFKKGEPIVQGFTDTGDHVFVDKMSYHFRKPRRGEVFVFDTRMIDTNDKFLDRYKTVRNPKANTQYYIKRLAGIGGDKMQVGPPLLYINGKVAEGFGYERVMRGTLQNPVDGYQGYSNMMPNLGNPGQVFEVPERRYFAMGDNSYHSSDSRDWGSVPEGNLMGTGVFVYWPFSRDTANGRGGRFGIIR